MDNSKTLLKKKIPQNKKLILILGICLLLVCLCATTLIILVVSVGKNRNDNPEKQIVKEDTLEDDIDQLPSPPQGYKWIECENLKSYFLIPDGWYKFEEEMETAKACFITKESIDKGGEFQTGLSVNLIVDISKKTSQYASDYAYDYISTMVEDYDSDGITELGNGDTLAGYGTTIRSTPENEQITMHVLAMANDGGDKVYIVWFESPTDIWQESWEIGEPVFTNIGFDVD